MIPQLAYDRLIDKMEGKRDGRSYLTLMDFA